MKIYFRYFNDVFSTFLTVSFLIGVVFSTAPLTAQTLQEALDSVLEPPAIVLNPGEKYSDENRTFHMNCGIAKTPGGRLWACWINGGDGPEASCLAVWSDDDGRTWTAPKFAIDPPNLPNRLERRVLIANFWTAPNGRLWFFFDYGLNMFDGRIGVWASVCENPDADVPVWSRPKRIANGSLHNKPIVDRSGAWLAPIELYDENYTKYSGDEIRRYYPEFNGFPELDGERGITIFASTDDGKTWKPRGRQIFPVSAGEEPELIEKKDGSLWLTARTPRGIYDSFSTDGGANWSDPTPSYKNPVTRFFLMKLASGNILFVKQGTLDGETKGRDRLTAWISCDEGRSWTGGLILDERQNVAYPDGFQDENGSIYVSYEHNRNNKENSEILFATFTESDVFTGKAVSDVARFKQTVSRTTKKTVDKTAN